MFSKGYSPNWYEEFFVIKKSKKLFRGNMLLVILKEKKLLERLMKTNYKKQTKKRLEPKK